MRRKRVLCPGRSRFRRRSFQLRILQQKQRNTLLNDLDLVVGDEFITFSSINKDGKEEIYKKIERTM